MGFCLTFSRIGTVSAPLVGLLGRVWLPLLFAVLALGSAAGLAGVVTLPETTGQKLPETTEEAEAIGREVSMWRQIGRRGREAKSADLD